MRRRWWVLLPAGAVVIYLASYWSDGWDGTLRLYNSPAAAKFYIPAAWLEAQVKQTPISVTAPITGTVNPSLGSIMAPVFYEHVSHPVGKSIVKQN